jgi:LuxR family maltose regulon positive regulatory protein
VLIEPLSRSEMRVLRYLPTNLPAPEIARELSVSVTTVRTRIRHLSVTLDAPPMTAVISLPSCRAKYPCITAYFPADK